MAEKVKLTEKEKEALRIYIGEIDKIMYLLYSATSEYPVSMPVFKCFPNIGEETNVYKIIDTMFYEDLFIERTYGSDKTIHCPTNLYNNINEVLEMIKSLYSVMYKYGKKVTEEKIVFRADEQEIVTRMQEEGKTILPLSTSKGGFIEEFHGAKPANVEITIKPNTLCVDMREVLGAKYIRPEEQEILVAPFCLIEIKEDETKRVGDIKYYKAIVSSPEKTKGFTKQEQIQNKYYRELVHDVDLLGTVKKVREIVNKEEIRNEQDCIAKVGNNDYKKFKKWKKALVSVVKYTCREVVLELENQYTASDVKSLSEKEPGKFTVEAIRGIFNFLESPKNQRKAKQGLSSKRERGEEYK